VIRFVTGFGLSIVGQLFVVLGLVATFLPLYVIFPDANVGLREAAPGTIVAAVGWFALSRTFSLYTGLATGYAVYGALGAVFLVLVWLYTSARSSSSSVRSSTQSSPTVKWIGSYKVPDIDRFRQKR